MKTAGQLSKITPGIYDYEKNVVNMAKRLVKIGMSDAIYTTQWSSGRAAWRYYDMSFTMDPHGEIYLNYPSDHGDTDANICEEAEQAFWRNEARNVARTIHVETGIKIEVYPTDEAAHSDDGVWVTCSLFIPKEN